MKLRRASIAWLMVAVAAVAFPCAIVGAILRDRPMFGLEDCLDLGLAPSVPLLGVYLFARVRRGTPIRAFDFGFLLFGWVAVIVYVVLSKSVPEMVAAPIVYYINEVEAQYMNCDLEACYILSLAIQGLILAMPQLLIAVLGGLLTQQLAGRRRQPRSDSTALPRSSGSIDADPDAPYAA
jgi:hypothetical protein